MEWISNKLMLLFSGNTRFMEELLISNDSFVYLYINKIKNQWYI